MSFFVTSKAITTLQTDTIVNPSDSVLSLGELQQAAGEKLRAACAAMRSIRVGDIRVTPAYDLPAKQVAHLILPDKTDDPDKIREYYATLFKIARSYGWNSVGIPLFPSGERTTLSSKEVYQIAVEAYRSFSKKRDIQVWLVVKKDQILLDAVSRPQVAAYINSRLTKKKALTSRPAPTPSAFADFAGAWYEDDATSADEIPASSAQQAPAERPREKFSIAWENRRDYAFSDLDVAAFSDLDDWEGELPFGLDSKPDKPLDQPVKRKPSDDVRPAEPEHPSGAKRDPRSDADMDAIYGRREPAHVVNHFYTKPAGFDLQLDESFAEAVLRIEKEKDLSDPELYNKANLSRAVFNKLKQSALNPQRGTYQPSKNTALALCIGLSLNTEESGALLKKAGYAISHSSLSDVIVERFLNQGVFDILKINDALFDYDQPLLGSA